MTLDEFNLVIHALDHLLCNGELPADRAKDVEELFYYLDAVGLIMEEEAEAAARLISKQDNVLVVDFSPKAG